jgi:hypothetical protein
MKHTLSLYLFFLLLAPNAYPQLVKVIDNKGTMKLKIANGFQSIRVLFIMLLKNQ